MSKIGHFGGHASEYAKYRPSYPETLFETIFRTVQNKGLAWDCGTGNGQVAVRLGEDFQKVHATDINSRQLEEAREHPRVSYLCSPAHHSELEDHSVDLVTVASAVHWFDIEAFYGEVQRVLKTDGILALWTYAPELLGPAPLAEVVRSLAQETFLDDWPEGIEWVSRHYADLPFPFQEIPCPKIDYPLQWDFDSLAGWVQTWSAFNRHKARTGIDLGDYVKESLREVWPGSIDQVVNLDFPLYVRVGRAT